MTRSHNVFVIRGQELTTQQLACLKKGREENAFPHCMEKATAKHQAGEDELDRSSLCFHALAISDDRIVGAIRFTFRGDGLPHELGYPLDAIMQCAGLRSDAMLVNLVLVDRVWVKADERRRGYFSALIDAPRDVLPDGAPVVLFAAVNSANVTSVAAFQHAGFALADIRMWKGTSFVYMVKTVHT